MPVASREELYAESLMKGLNLDVKKWNSMPSESGITEMAKAVEKRGIRVLVVDNRAQALEKLKELIPPGAEVMNGSSTTLIQAGFTDLLESGRWSSVHRAVAAENDKQKRDDLRRRSVTADYFLAGVNAIAMTGELAAADASGSRVGAFPFAAKNLILVSGANKIVPTLEDALARICEYAYPLEDARMKKSYGMGSRIGKMVIIAQEMFQGRTTLILVRERLGF